LPLLLFFLSYGPSAHFWAMTFTNVPHLPERKMTLSKMTPKNKTSAKKKYFTINLKYFIHKAN
jgi:hypothetical protein